MTVLPFVVAVAFIVALTAAPASPGDCLASVRKNENLTAGKPPFRRTFLDAMVVEESQGLTRMFHSAEKYDGNPVMKKDKPWEGWGPYLYGTVVKDGGKLKMWYSCIGQGSGYICYAESQDGIHWEKPDVGLVEYNGSTANNIVRKGGLPSVMKLADSSDPDRQWVLFGWLRDNGPCAFFSADGLHWPAEPAKEKLFRTSDVINFFYDPYRKRYVSTYKTGNRRHRAVGVAVSKDALDWSKPVEGAVFGADDLDPDATQVYGMPAFPYQGMYIGLPWIYHSRWMKYGKYEKPEQMYEAELGSPLTVDVQMAWGWNLISWTRTPQRKPFISLGPDGSFDSKMIFTARAPVEMGDKLCFYYGGSPRLHNRDGPHEGFDFSIGLATLRLDGFCSMHAGDREGSLISRVEVFRTPKVTINAKTTGNGYVVAEILDRNNKVIDGFSRDDCAPFTGDSVRWRMQWKKKEFSSDVLDSEKKIRFYLKNADLYSYLPVDIDQEKDTGWSVE